MIGVLAAAGSATPTAIIAPSILATFVGTVAAVIAAKILQRLYPQPPARKGREVRMIRAALDAISLWAIPVMLVGIPFVGLLRKVKVYDVFIEGAKEGFDVASPHHPVPRRHPRRDRDVPRLRCDGPARRRASARRGHDRLPAELVPLAILRSLTGSGSLAFTTDLIKTHGPDSLIARTAATMYGSSETTFYVLAVYCGAIGVRRTRHAVPAALIGDIVAAVAAVAVCAWMF